MPGKELKYKPLVEAILEIKWNLSKGSAPEMEADPHYRLLLGRFSERVQTDYPFHEPLPTAQVPDEMVAYMPQHRFRVAEKTWPLVQIGPGIMTVNETDGYTWKSFEERCHKAVTYLLEAHPVREQFHVRESTLRYVDAVDVDFHQESVFHFLKDKLKTAIGLPDSLFEGSHVGKDPVGFNWQVSFPHDEPGGIITVRFAMGKRQGKPALIWETSVQTRDGQAQVPLESFSDWLDQAHQLAHDWFFKLIEGDLERRFSGEG